MRFSLRDSGAAAADPVYETRDSRHVMVRALEKLLAFLGTLLLWAFLLATLYYKLVVESNPQEESVLRIICIALAGSVVILGLWQLYNWLRFRNKARRKEFRMQGLEEVGRLYGISGGNMLRLQEIRSLAVVEFKNHRYYYCTEGQDPIEIGMLRKK